jgi:hypothetical protein
MTGPGSLPVVPKYLKNERCQGDKASGRAFPAAAVPRETSLQFG